MKSRITAGTKPTYNSGGRNLYSGSNNLRRLVFTRDITLWIFVWGTTFAKRHQDVNTYCTGWYRLPRLLQQMRQGWLSRVTALPHSHRAGIDLIFALMLESKLREAWSFALHLMTDNDRKLISTSATLSPFFVFYFCDQVASYSAERRVNYLQSS